MAIPAGKANVSLRGDRGLQMTVELNKDDIKMLVNLVTAEIDKVGEAKEKHGFGDLGYFYHLVDIRNKLLCTPLSEDLPSGFSDGEWRELFGGKSLR